MGIELIAELATGHGGDLELAKRMIEAAAGAGANMVKTQAYDLAKLNPSDPQAEWLTKAHLTHADHAELKAHADSLGVRYFASAFDIESADFVLKLCGAVKFASSVRRMLSSPLALVFKTYPWEIDPGAVYGGDHVTLVTVPLYPTPLECVGRVNFAGAMGWSDHCVGLAGCHYALRHPLQYIEVHMTTPDAARQAKWDKTPEQVRELRCLLDDMETIKVGVSQTFRDRWVR